MKDHPPSRRLLVISPVKDEARFLRRTIDSLAAQRCRPTRWIIVDDGSADETGAIADAAAADHPWIEVLHRPAGAPRRVGPGVIEAFYAGLARADLKDHDYVCKLDGDLELDPGYFEELFRRFEADPHLGTASGKAYIPVGGRFVLERTGDEFSHGVAKLFRRECFEAIGGFVREVMWDGIDCHRCRMLGWKAASYPDESLAIRHLRQMGSSFRSVYHGRLRWGRGQHFMGTHPLYLLGIAGYRMFERPWALGGLCILMGYVGSAARHRPRYEDPAFRRFLRSWQMRSLAGRASCRVGGARVGAAPPGRSRPARAGPDEARARPGPARCGLA
jgi:glycosyltransferase involved in cell wall biosynthesis